MLEAIKFRWKRRAALRSRWNLINNDYEMISLDTIIDNCVYEIVYQA